MSWLVVRRSGALWAIPADRVRAVESSGTETRVRLPGAVLAADEVLRFVSDLPITPAGPILRGLWRQTVGGLALCDGQPAVLVDDRALPEFLIADDPRIEATDDPADRWVQTESSDGATNVPRDRGEPEKETP